MIINGSLKDFLLGKKLAEVYCIFEQNYDTKSKQVYYNRVYYQLLFDIGADGEHFVVDVYAR